MGFVESTVNEVVSKRFCKKQQMQWSKEGTHLLLQTRVRTLNGESLFLDSGVFCSRVDREAQFIFQTMEKIRAARKRA